MSLQLTLANAAAAESERRWRDHRRECPPCSTAQRSRNHDGMCRAGRRLYADMKECQAELEDERRLAKLPYPGQEALFTEAEAQVTP